MRIERTVLRCRIAHALEHHLREHRVELARRYADLFRVFVAHRDVIDRVTFWGVGDGDSWLNGWPVPGRTSYPLLFDRADQPKPAFDSVLATAREGLRQAGDRDIFDPHRAVRARPEAAIDCAVCIQHENGEGLVVVVLE